MSKQFIRCVAQGMKENNIGVRDLARKCGLDASFISKMMQGKRNPPSEESAIKKIAEALFLDPLMLVIYAGRIPASLQDVFESPSFISAAVKNAGLPQEKRMPPARPAARQPASAAPVGADDASAELPELKVELL